MTLSRMLQRSARLLLMNGIEAPYTEAKILLGHITSMSPVQIYTEPEQTLSCREKDDLRKLVARRLKHEPIAYILKNKEFYGINFHIDSRVLIPRPETETLVDAAIQFAGNRSQNLKRQLAVADIGTGCGAIAVSLALNIPESKIYATDISSAALEVAALNCKEHGVTQQVALLLGDLLQPLPKPVDLVVANLPYVKSSDFSKLSAEIAEFEPGIALDGGESGLDCITRLLLQLSNKIIAGGCLLLEIGQNQDRDVSRLIGGYLGGRNFEFLEDLNGINRAVKIDL
jgi:release factor glutamine methyltransferase